jgi:hypothetical protein
MTPKEKADELFTKYYVILLETDSGVSEEITISLLSKQFALIAAKEVLYDVRNYSRKDYWLQVIKEIEKL